MIMPSTTLACLPQQGSGRWRLQLRWFRPLPLLESGKIMTAKRTQDSFGKAPSIGSAWASRSQPSVRSLGFIWCQGELVGCPWSRRDTATTSFLLVSTAGSTSILIFGDNRSISGRPWNVGPILMAFLLSCSRAARRRTSPLSSYRRTRPSSSHPPRGIRLTSHAPRSIRLTSQRHIFIPQYLHRGGSSGS
jgi:hypothetical protein